MSPCPLRRAVSHSQRAAGSSIVPEKLSGTAGEQYIYWRTPGLKAFGTSGGATSRTLLASASRFMPLLTIPVFVLVIGGQGRHSPELCLAPRRSSWREITRRPHIAIVLPAMAWCRSRAARFLRGRMLMLDSLTLSSSCVVRSSSRMATGKSATPALIRPASTRWMWRRRRASLTRSIARSSLGNGQMLMVGSSSSGGLGRAVQRYGLLAELRRYDTARHCRALCYHRLAGWLGQGSVASVTT